MLRFTISFGGLLMMGRQAREESLFLSLPVSRSFAFFFSSGQVHAVAICGVDLRLRNRTRRFRFCAVAAR